jgi:hypothetical protein
VAGRGGARREGGHLTPPNRPSATGTIGAWEDSHMARRDPRVDAYIDALPEWQQEICRRVRELVLAVDPELIETIKRTNRPYYVLAGNVCAILAARDHVNVFLYDGAIVPDPEGIVTGGHDNQTARTVAIRDARTLNEGALVAMLRQIVANNRAGGWRKLKARGS